MGVDVYSNPYLTTILAIKRELEIESNLVTKY